MVVKRFAADCAVDQAAKLLSLERHDVAVEVIASRGIVEGKIDARNDRARRANGPEHHVPNGGRNQSKPFEHQPAPFGTARMSFLPSRFQLMGAFFSQGRKQGVGLLQVLVALCKPFRTPAGDDELVDGVARRSRHVHVDGGAVQDDRGLGIADQEIQEAQRLGVRVQGGQLLGTTGLLALVGREKVDAQAAFGGIAGRAPAIRYVRDGTKGFVDFLQHVQNRRVESSIATETFLNWGISTSPV